MPKFVRLEAWDDFEAASGTLQSVFTQIISLTDTIEVMGTDRLTATVASTDPALAALPARGVLRLVYNDGAEQVTEWRLAVRNTQRKGDQVIVRLEADPVLLELANETIVFEETDSAARLHDFQLIGVDTDEQLGQILNAINDDAAMTWTAGTIDVTQELDVVYGWDTPLSALRKLAAANESEISIRKNGATGYFIDLLTTIGSAAAQVELRTSVNLPEIDRRELFREQATIVIPRGQPVNGFHGSIRRAIWGTLGAVTSTTVDARGQFTGDTSGQTGPIAFDDQYVGAAQGGYGPSMYLKFYDPVDDAMEWVGPITATTVTNQRITMASTGDLTAGRPFAITPSNTDDREGLREIINPAGVTTFGPIRKVLDLPDIIGVQNLLVYSSLSRWVSGLSAGGNAFGPTPSTVTENTDQAFIKFGTGSAKVVCTADGDGYQTGWTQFQGSGVNSGLGIEPGTTLDDLLSGFFVFWNDNAGTGRVRMDIGLGGGLTPGGVLSEFYYFPLSTSDDTKAFSTKTKQWVTLGVSGIDPKKNLFTDTSLAVTHYSMRIMQDGATATTFYVDAMQLTRTAAHVPYVEANGSNMMVVEANKYLTTHAAADVEYRLKAIDLEGIDAGTWSMFEFLLGQTARVIDVPNGISDTVRLVSLSRDWLHPGNTALQLSTNARTLSNAVAVAGNPQLGRTVDIDPDDSVVAAVSPGGGGSGGSGGSTLGSYGIDGWELGSQPTQNTAKTVAIVIGRPTTNESYLTSHDLGVTKLVVRVPSNATLTVGTVTISVVKEANLVTATTADATVDTVLEIALSSANIAQAASTGGLEVSVDSTAFTLPSGHGVYVAYSSTATLTQSNMDIRAAVVVVGAAVVPVPLEGAGPSGLFDSSLASANSGTGPHMSPTGDTDISVAVWFKRDQDNGTAFNYIWLDGATDNMYLSWDVTNNYYRLYHRGVTTNHIESIDLGEDDAGTWVGIAISWSRTGTNRPNITVLWPSRSFDAYPATITEETAISGGFWGHGFNGYTIGGNESDATTARFDGNIHHFICEMGAVWSAADRLAQLKVPGSVAGYDVWQAGDDDWLDESANNNDCGVRNPTNFSNIGAPVPIP